MNQPPRRWVHRARRIISQSRISRWATASPMPAATLALIVIAVALIPSSSGFVPSLGMAATTRSDLGAGLLTGAAVGTLLTAYQQHRENLAATRRRNLAIAPAASALSRLVSDITERHLNALLRASHGMQSEKFAPQCMLTGPDRAWETGSLQQNALGLHRLLAYVQPRRSPADALVLLGVLQVIQTVLDGAALVAPPADPLDERKPDGGATRHDIARLTHDALESMDVAAQHLLTDGDGRATWVTLTRQRLADLASQVDGDRPAELALRLAERACEGLHPGSSLDAQSAAMRLRALDGSIPGQGDAGCWWSNPDVLQDWAWDVGVHLEHGGEPGDLLRGEFKTVPFRWAPRPPHDLDHSASGLGQDD